MEEFHEANQQNNKNESRQLDKGVLWWIAHPHGVFKITWDATLDQRRKLMGVGFIVRDHEGKVIATMCSSMKFIINPTMVEDYVAWKVVVFCRDLGLKNVILEGDTLNIVHVLHKEEHSWSRYGNLLADTKFI